MKRNVVRLDTQRIPQLLRSGGDRCISNIPQKFEEIAGGAGRSRSGPGWARFLSASTGGCVGCVGCVIGGSVADC